MNTIINEIYKLYDVIDSHKKILYENPGLPGLKRLLSPLEVEKKDWRITSSFTEIRDGRPHNALDIFATSGSKILSPADGVVEAATFTSGNCGGNIVIKHSNGFKSGFCHVRKINVAPGQNVEKGQEIGETGGGPNDKGKGKTTGPHLHYQLELNGNFVDPTNYTGTLLEVLSEDPIFLNLDAETKEKILNQVKDILKNVGMYGGIAAAIGLSFKVLSAFVKSPKSSTPNTGASTASAASTTTQPADLTAKYVGDVIRGVLPG